MDNTRLCRLPRARATSTVNPNRAKANVASIKGAPNIAPIPTASPCPLEPNMTAITGMEDSGRAVPTAARRPPVAWWESLYIRPTCSTALVKSSQPNKITGIEPTSTTALSRGAPSTSRSSRKANKHEPKAVRMIKNPTNCPARPSPRTIKPKTPPFLTPDSSPSQEPPINGEPTKRERLHEHTTYLHGKKPQPRQDFLEAQERF